MGIGTIIGGVRADAAAGLRAWGSLIADAAQTIRPIAGSRLEPIGEASRLLAPVDESLVRTVGWEARDAFRSAFDDQSCVQRAQFIAMSLAERVTGSIPAALANVGAADARTGALAVAYHVRLPSGEFNLHSVPLFRTTSDELLVIDHMLATSEDGVMRYHDWLAAIHGTEANTAITERTMKGMVKITWPVRMNSHDCRKPPNPP